MAVHTKYDFSFRTSCIIEHVQKYDAKCEAFGAKHIYIATV